MRLIEFTETPAEVYGLTQAKRDAYEREHQSKVMINPEQVGAVLPRKNYTTVIVGGHYVYLAHDFDYVVRRLRS